MSIRKKARKYAKSIREELKDSILKNEAFSISKRICLKVSIGPTKRKELSTNLVNNSQTISQKPKIMIFFPLFLIFPLLLKTRSFMLCEQYSLRINIQKLKSALPIFAQKRIIQEKNRIPHPVKYRLQTSDPLQKGLHNTFPNPSSSLLRQ